MVTKQFGRLPPGGMCECVMCEYVDVWMCGCMDVRMCGCVRASCDPITGA